jgi:hypothetical protein
VRSFLSMSMILIGLTGRWRELRDIFIACVLYEAARRIPEEGSRGAELALHAGQSKSAIQITCPCSLLLLPYSPRFCRKLMIVVRTPTH